MRTSDRGSSRHFRPESLRGFTLIELLVVLVVMGIALGLVSVRLMPDDASRLRETGEQLALLLENAELQARSSGVPMAWVGKRDEYMFYQRNRQGLWEPVETGPFRRRALQVGVSIVAVELDGKPVELGSRVPLSATSFTSPFNIKLGAGTSALYVVGNGVGRVTVLMDRNANAITAH